MARKNELDFLKESYFKDKKFFRFFCPNCKKERRIPADPNPWRFRHVFKVAVATVFTMLVCWDLFEFKGLVVFVPYWIIFEATYRIWMRAQIPCSGCGFDPYLFLQDEKLAAKEIENYWRIKFKEKGIPFPSDPVEEPETEQEVLEESTESIQDLDKSIEEVATREMDELGESR